MAAMALGAKGAAVQKGIASVPPVPRPWAPAVEPVKRSFPDRVRALLTHLGR